MDMYALLFLKWITDKDLLYSTENSAQCYVAAQDGREIWERMDTCIRMSELLFYAPELPQLYSNIKKKVKIRKGKTEAKQTNKQTRTEESSCLPSMVLTLAFYSIQAIRSEKNRIPAIF